MPENNNPADPSQNDLITWTNRFNEESANRLTPEAKQLRDLASAYSRMDNLLRDPSYQFGETTFLEMHNILAENIPGITGDRGRYYTRPRKILLDPVWEFIPFVEGNAKIPAMKELGEDYQKYMQQRDIKPIDSTGVIQKAADIITRICHIHPFLDGNGRTSRLLADSIFLRAKMHQVPYWTNPNLNASERKIKLHKAIIDSVRGNPNQLLILLATEQIRACRDEAQALLADPRIKGDPSAAEEIQRQENFVRILADYVDRLEENRSLTAN